MKRYKKANEGIHAPEEAKEKAARPAGKPSRARWMGAVAALLAVVILGGVALWPRQSNAPDPRSLNGPGSPILNPTPGAVARANALAAVVYPEMAPYPNETDYYSANGEWDWDSYNDAYHAWWESRTALRSGTDYTGMLDGFLSASTAQFLTNAGEDNRVYSPLNVYLALSMLAETTGGNSRQQILNLLQADSIETLRARISALWKDHYRDDGIVTSLLANSLWLRDGMTYSQEVLDTLARDYYAFSFSGEMGSEEYNQALRSWINEQTGGLLREQAEGLEMDRATVLALASTIYFKAAWSDKFPEHLTQRDVFHAPTGDVETDFMRQFMEGTYYWGERFSAVQLHFKERGGSMWLILPDEGIGPDDLLTSGEAMDFLLAEKRGTWNEKTGKTEGGWEGQKDLTVNLSVPKFDVSSDLDLIGGLQELGVTDIFNGAVSNFDPLGASTDDPLYVSTAQHAARVKVDEEGCEAAAYTVIMVDAAAAMPPEEEVDFVLDRPFLFAITGDSGLPLFTGVVNQPNG